MSLPKVIYVYEDQERNGVKFLVASTDAKEQDNGIVGVYDLRETLHIRHQAQFRRSKTKTWFPSS